VPRNRERSVRTIFTEEGWGNAGWMEVAEYRTGDCADHFTNVLATTCGHLSALGWTWYFTICYRASVNSRVSVGRQNASRIPSACVPEYEWRHGSGPVVLARKASLHHRLPSVLCLRLSALRYGSPGANALRIYIRAAFAFQNGPACNAQKPDLRARQRLGVSEASRGHLFSQTGRRVKDGGCFSPLESGVADASLRLASLPPR